jgi:hypothetical protein
VELLLGEPVSRSSVKSSLHRRSRGQGARFIRLCRGRALRSSGLTRMLFSLVPRRQLLQRATERGPSASGATVTRSARTARADTKTETLQPSSQATPVTKIQLLDNVTRFPNHALSLRSEIGAKPLGHLVSDVSRRWPTVAAESFEQDLRLFDLEEVIEAKPLDTLRLNIE